MATTAQFRFGIEHEFAVIDAASRFLDFSNTSFDELQRVIDTLPLIESDYPGLRVGDLGIKNKRWYIEGFERFSDTGEYLRTDPKGFEIRTPICASLDEAVDTLTADLQRWADVARGYGYAAVRTSLNPFSSGYVPDPSLNPHELQMRRSPEEQTAHIHMLTYGPDISLSSDGWTAEQTIDIARKFTYYGPAIVPFSFSSPFFEGRLWGGLSRRTYYRTGARPVALVFVGDERLIAPSSPTLTDRARIPAEVGRIEFKAFDCPRDIEMYRSLGALLLGVALDDTLRGRATVPDAARHQASGLHAFSDESVLTESQEVLTAARRALPADMRELLGPLERMLAEHTTPAHEMIEIFERTGDITAAIT